MSKVTLWDRAGTQRDRITRPNQINADKPYRSLDFQGISDWLIEVLGRFSSYPVEAIIPIGHGAAFAGLKGDQLAFQPFDYDQPIPDDVMSEYRSQRDAFSLTGSPALACGLNMGAQLHWLEQLQGPAFESATLLPWAQLWSWVLSGEARSEVTSLGCHSDLWAPALATYSSLAARRGWVNQFAPIAQAGATIGTLRPDIAEKTGLPPETRIHCGLHDSNAALVAARGFADLADRDAMLLSTGTWFIAMRTLAADSYVPTLDEARDCLANVDVEGRTVPSARYMGGREVEMLGGGIDRPGLDGLEAVLAKGLMITPSLVPDCGPFPDATSRWIGTPANDAERQAATALYAALMAATAINLVGPAECLLIEGRFARSELFTRTLASLLPDCDVMLCEAELDASFGALRLIWPDLVADAPLRRVDPLPRDITAYAERWAALNHKQEHA